MLIFKKGVIYEKNILVLSVLFCLTLSFQIFSQSNQAPKGKIKYGDWGKLKIHVYYDKKYFYPYDDIDGYYSLIRPYRRYAAVVKRMDYLIKTKKPPLLRRLFQINIK